jgi:hypothetical protein
MDAPGRLRLDLTPGAAAAPYEGHCVVTTNDDTRAAADVALGYPRLRWSAGGCRGMQTTGRHTRPLSHWRPHRLIAPVPLWVLAWRRQRAAELRGQQTWRTIRQTLDHFTVGRSRRQGKTMLHRPRVTALLAEILPTRGMPVPKKMLDGSD